METDEEITEQQGPATDGDWIAEQADLITLEDGFDA